MEIYGKCSWQRYILMDYGMDPIKYGQAFQIFYMSLCEETGMCV